MQGLKRLDASLSPPPNKIRCTDRTDARAEQTGPDSKELVAERLHDRNRQKHGSDSTNYTPHKRTTCCHSLTLLMENCI